MSATALASLGAFVAAVIAVGLYHFTLLRPALARLRNDGGQAAGVATSRGGDGSSAAILAKRTEERLLELERVAGRDVYRVGFLRYNSFSDVGSDLSFALALLNRDGDGVVISSIYSREETRTYGKAVRKFIPQHDASREEQQAIAMARTGMGS